MPYQSGSEDEYTTYIFDGIDKGPAKIIKGRLRVPSSNVYNIDIVLCALAKKLRNEETTYYVCEFNLNTLEFTELYELNLSNNYLINTGYNPSVLVGGENTFEASSSPYSIDNHIFLLYIPSSYRSLNYDSGIYHDFYMTSLNNNGEDQVLVYNKKISNIAIN